MRKYILNKYHEYINLYDSIYEYHFVKREMKMISIIIDKKSNYDKGIVMIGADHIAAFNEKIKNGKLKNLYCHNLKK